MLGVFKSNLDDDSLESSAGDIVVPAGKNVAIAICDQLKVMGYKPTPPKQYSFFGWAFRFRLDRSMIWILLQQPGPWLLTVDARGTGLHLVKCRCVAHSEIVLLENPVLVLNGMDLMYGRT